MLLQLSLSLSISHLLSSLHAESLRTNPIIHPESLLFCSELRRATFFIFLCTLLHYSPIRCEYFRLSLAHTRSRSRAIADYRNPLELVYTSSTYVLGVCVFVF